MPLFALSLNIAWELLYSINDLFIISSSNDLQAIVNLIWACLDLIIVYTYFKYGKKYFLDSSGKYFLPYSILVFITGFAIQFAFYFSFNSLAAAQYSAFMQNVAMSILFLVMLFQRKESTGQTLLMAVSKWIGTLAPALLMGLIQDFNPYIIICGVICSMFDLLYIYFLGKKRLKRSSIK